MVHKIADSKGRIGLGSRFAGKMVIIDDEDPNRIVITPAVAIPEREAWLYQNDEALNLVREGVNQAREHQFAASPPDLLSDAS